MLGFSFSLNNNSDQNAELDMGLLICLLNLEKSVHNYFFFNLVKLFCWVKQILTTGNRSTTVSVFDLFSNMIAHSDRTWVAEFWLASYKKCRSAGRALICSSNLDPWTLWLVQWAVGLDPLLFPKRTQCSSGEMQANDWSSTTWQKQYHVNLHTCEFSSAA